MDDLEYEALAWLAAGNSVFRPRFATPDAQEAFHGVVALLGQLRDKGLVDYSERHITQTSSEARLRPEFASLYPGLEPGTWQDATTLAEQMLTEHLLRPSPGYMLSDRVLAKERFEFRGGDHRQRPRIARTRRTDPAI